MACNSNPCVQGSRAATAEMWIDRREGHTPQYHQQQQASGICCGEDGPLPITNQCKAEPIV